MLRIDKLNWNNGDRPILEDLTFHIAPGEIYGLLGAKGAGKTTLINLICNLLPLSSGKIRINRQPISSTTKSLLGVVPSTDLFYPRLTCQEHLNFFAQLYGLTPAKRAQQTQACLEIVQLADQAKTLAGHLTVLMQRRLSFAIALIHQPKLLLLDEPTAGLDSQTRLEIWALIHHLHEQGLTLLLTTEHAAEAEDLCQSIGILQRGQLLAAGTLADLRQYIPAAAIAVLQTSDEAAAIARARELGFPLRRYEGKLACWLPTSLTVEETRDRFAGIPVEGVDLHPIGLEQVYREITQGAPREFFVPESLSDPWD